MKNIAVTLLASTLICIGVFSFAYGSQETEAFRDSLVRRLADVMAHQMQRRSTSGFRSAPAAHSDLSSRIYPNYDYLDNDLFNHVEAFKRNYNAKEFIKKSLADQKSLRFHQCYFNPISCFR